LLTCRDGRELNPDLESGGSRSFFLSSLLETRASHKAQPAHSKPSSASLRQETRYPANSSSGNSQVHLVSATRNSGPEGIDKE